METPGRVTLDEVFHFRVTPHSLGKLIEWKPALDLTINGIFQWAPHSLGKLIEWKLP